MTSGALLAVRLAESALAPVWLSSAVATGGALLGSLWRARRSFFTQEQALARLDEALGLGQRLMAAAEGVADWPPLPERTPDGLAWRRSLLGVPLVCGALLAAALWVPLEPRRALAAREVVEPLAWARIEAAVEVLEEEALFEERALEAMRERLEALRAQPTDTWYQHGSLEAGDSLEEQMDRSLAELGRDVAQVERVLAGLDESARGAGAERAREDALERLGSGEFPLRSEALRELRALDREELRAASPEERRRLLQNLERAGRASAEARGLEGESWRLAGEPRLGRGSITRGRGDAPLTLGRVASQVEVAGREDLKSRSLARGVPSELIELRAGAPEVDRTVTAGARTGGAVQPSAREGEATWRTPLPPEEQALVKRYFR